MKLNIDKKDLLPAVETALKAISGHSTLPILSSMLLQAEEETLRLTGSDLEIGISTTVGATVLEAGATTIPARLLQETLKNWPDGTLEWSTDERDLTTLQTGHSVYTLHGLPADEFPFVPTVEGETMTIPQAELKQLLSLTLPAVSHDTSRVILTGVLFALDGHLRSVATDTHRLATAPGTVPLTIGERQVIIPGDTLATVEKLLKDDESEVVVALVENYVEFDLGSTRIVSRVIEGQFPNWRAVLPGAPTGELTLPTNALRGALKRAQLVARENAHKVIFRVASSLTGATLTLTAESGRVGKAREELDCEANGEITFALSAEYTLDALNVIPTPRLRLAWGDGPTQPLVLTPVGGPEFIYVLMPMQIV